MHLFYLFLIQNFTGKISVKTTLCKNELDKGSETFKYLSADVAAGNTSLHGILSEGTNMQVQSLQEVLQTVNDFVNKQMREDLPTGKLFFC